MEFIQYYDENKILLAIYLPHSTHTLQPLDVCLFKPLSSAYSSELADFMDKCQGLTSITKRDFFRMFYSAWGTSFKEKTILTAFEVTGLSPLNPQQVLNRFNIEEKERPSSSESSTSVLSASDWRKIERLLRKVVADVYDKPARQLSQTIHSISVRNNLLQHENDRLREALINERKRRQRGKPLLLEAPTNYDGGAIFWSPSKVQDARDRQVQKEEAERALQLQKDEETQRKREQKAEKARMLEERKHMRAVAKEIRLQEQRTKAAAREEAKITRQANQQLKNNLKQAKKGKQKASTPPPTSSEDEEDVDELIMDVGPTTAKSRRVRQIKLPKRYCN